MAKKIKFVELVLRDGHQSQTATRMRTEQMIPMLEHLDNIGYHALEAWGGATFDSCLRFLNEDPWERLRAIKKHIHKTPLQMLLRGQNVVGYRHYSDDFVQDFCKRSVDNGMTIFRVFDALNDSRNLEVAMKAVKTAGGHAQGTLVYTISEYHTTERNLAFVDELVKLGADSICIKDMSGLLMPFVAYELVSKIKAKYPNIELNLHSHYTAGMASMTLLKAIEAGVDIIDTCLSPFSGTTSHAATETMINVLKGTEFDSGLDVNDLQIAVEHFRKVKKDTIAEFNLPADSGVNPKVLDFQIPGGMLSNFRNQIFELGGNEEKYEELLLEMPKTRKDAGFPPLVTPTSQIVGSQAFLNVMFGRYKNISTEFRNLVLGKYGRTPAEPDHELLRMCESVGGKRITHRPADDLSNDLENLRKELEQKGFLNPSDEDVLSYGLSPEAAEHYFKSNWSAMNAYKKES